MNLLRVLDRLPEHKLRALIKVKRLVKHRESLAKDVAVAESVLALSMKRLNAVDSRIKRALNGGLRAGGRPTSKRSRGRKGGRVGRLGPALEAALRKIGRAAGATELADLVLKAGHQTRSKGRVFVQAVYQALARGGRFRKIGRGKYALKG